MTVTIEHGSTKMTIIFTPMVLYTFISMATTTLVPLA